MNESPNRTLFDLTAKPACINPMWLEMRMKTSRDLQALAFFEREAAKRKPYRMEDGIAVFDVSGPLWNGEGWFLENNFYRNLQKNFGAALSDAEVKGILFNLDSPGGEAGGMFDLADAIYNARGIKPVWAIANEEAFSAAYGIASAADRIYVTRTGGVGSVGVVAVHVEYSQENKMLGWNYTLFRGGKYKAEQNGIEPLTGHAQESIQSEVDRIYGMFVDLAARNRSTPSEKIRATEAALYFGENAVQAGLADRLGNFEQALNDFKQSISRPGGNLNMSNQTTDNNQAPALQANNQPSPPSQNETAPQAATSQQQPTQAPAAAPMAAGIDLDAIYKQADEKARADIQTINDLCALAHRPEMAAQLIGERLTPDQARKKLLNVMADECDATAIDSRLNVDRAMGSTQAQAPKINAADIYSRRREQMTAVKR
jgi:capsid assembly protease